MIYVYLLSVQNTLIIFDKYINNIQEMHYYFVCYSTYIHSLTQPGKLKNKIKKEG